jgi:hypothetical protein
VGEEAGAGPLGVGEGSVLHPVTAGCNRQTRANKVLTSVRRRKSACLDMPSTLWRVVHRGWR